MCAPDSPGGTPGHKRGTLGIPASSRHAVALLPPIGVRASNRTAQAVWEETSEQVESAGQVVCHFHAAGVGGAPAGQGPPGRAGGRWAGGRGVRSGPEEQPVSGLESDVVGDLLPAPVRAVEIAKPQGGTRMLGVPTVGDRIAQTVVALMLEPRTEQIFHADSYGYRPGRSAHHALAVCRERCWKKHWVLNIDIRAFLDSLNHDLVVKAVTANITAERQWVPYVKRWLTAPLQHPDGT